MNKTIREVLSWHKKQFPDATLDDIIKKLQEEIIELMYELKGKDLLKQKDEIADVMIVSIALKRYLDISIRPKMKCHHYFSIEECLHELGMESVERKRLEYAIQDFYYSCEYYLRYHGFSIVGAINDKMEVNLSRDWTCR